MKLASNANLDEDFILIQSTLSTACASGATSPTTFVCNNYPASASVYEWEFSPFGVNSGLCTGAVKLKSGEEVTLQACNVNSSTFWIEDPKYATTFAGFTYMPLVNAQSTGPKSTFVLTVDLDNRYLRIFKLALTDCARRAVEIPPPPQLFSMFTGVVP